MSDSLLLPSLYFVNNQPSVISRNQSHVTSHRKKLVNKANNFNHHPNLYIPRHDTLHNLKENHLGIWRKLARNVLARRGDIYIYNGANSAKRTSKGGEKRRGEDAIGDSAVVFARSEVRCIILLEWIIHTRHLHGMRKSRSFINSSPSPGGIPDSSLPSQRPTPSLAILLSSAFEKRKGGREGGRGEETRKGTRRGRRGEETSSR